MDPFAAPPPVTDPARLALELERTVDRLRSMSLVRLSAARPDLGTRAQEAFALAQRIVGATAGLTGEPERKLPVLPDPSVGDVLAVVGHDLLAELGESEPVRARQVCSEAVDALITLRQIL